MVNHFVIRHRLAALAVGLLLSLSAQAGLFPQFGPVTGVLKGSATSPQTSAATSADIIALWSGTCDVTKALRGDGSCGVFTTSTAALTRVDDTNVTLTLGGSPSTALLNATSITAGWTGTLAASRGGLGMSTVTDDTVAVANGSTWQSKAVPDCDTATGVLQYDTATNAFSCGTNASPSGAALTKTDDTNVTLTLGGAPTTALVNAASITAGWTGTLAASRGGLGMSTVTDDTLAVANGSTWQSKALTDCDAATSAVTYDTTTNAFGCNTINGATGANPSASVGLSAVNGAASTFMRSDGAPALSQSIVPTWTGAHTFSPASGVTRITSSNAALRFSATGAATDKKTWDTVVLDSTGAFSLRHLNDAESSSTTWLSATPSGTTSGLSSISIGDTSSNPSFTFNGTGTITTGGLVRAATGGTASFDARGQTTGASSTSYYTITDSAGTRQGYFGDGSGLSNIEIVADIGALNITTATGTTFNAGSAKGSGTINAASYYSDGQYNWNAGLSGYMELVNRSAGALGLKIYHGALGSVPLTTFGATGSLYMTGATGGDQGAGTINAQGLYINGVSVAGGSTTSSTFTATLTGGGFSGTVTCTLKYRLTGSQVSIFVDAGGTCTGTSSANTFTWSGLPSAIRPSANATVTGLCTDNGLDVPCGATFQSSGNVTMTKDGGSTFSSSGWTASGTKGFGSAVFIYDLRN
jgi:hypothetical protein